MEDYRGMKPIGSWWRMEFQARITDNSVLIDLPIEESNRARALLRAIRARFFIQDKYLAKFEQPLYISTLVTVIRHDKDFIEHQIVWSPQTGFIKERIKT